MGKSFVGDKRGLLSLTMPDHYQSCLRPCNMDQFFRHSHEILELPKSETGAQDVAKVPII